MKRVVRVTIVCNKAEASGEGRGESEAGKSDCEVAWAITVVPETPRSLSLLLRLYTRKVSISLKLRELPLSNLPSLQPQAYGYWGLWYYHSIPHNRTDPLTVLSSVSDSPRASTIEYRRAGM